MGTIFKPSAGSPTPIAPVTEGVRGVDATDEPLLPAPPPLVLPLVLLLAEAAADDLFCMKRDMDTHRRLALVPCAF